MLREINMISVCLMKRECIILSIKKILSSGNRSVQLIMWRCENLITEETLLGESTACNPKSNSLCYENKWIYTMYGKPKQISSRISIRNHQLLVNHPDRLFYGPGLSRELGKGVSSENCVYVLSSNPVYLKLLLYSTQILPLFNPSVLAFLWRL